MNQDENSFVSELTKIIPDEALLSHLRDVIVKGLAAAGVFQQLPESFIEEIKP